MPSPNKVVTRFAPSPTGLLHIGNARAALFNFLYARQNKGTFILRIEDTDRSRSKPEFEQDIIESLKWLGLEWDVMHKQSQRLGIYKKYLDTLLAEGKAYEKGGAVYFSLKAQISKLKTVEFNDLVRGMIATPVEVLDDFVIVKSDGTPLFLFTNVIDDFEMNITHVIRGEDHISNTPRQILIAQALGLNVPQYDHIPIVLAPDRTKLSKRHGAVAVSEFRAQGYLPQALVNAMALLGWNPGDEREHFTLKELIKIFTLERVQKGGAIFNVEKLNDLNAYYIRRLPDDVLYNELKPFVERLERVDKAMALKVIAITKDRLTRLSEFEGLTWYLFDEPAVDKKMLVFKASSAQKTKQGLQAVAKAIESRRAIHRTVESVNDLLKKIVKEHKLSNGDVYWPVRCALSGQPASPSPAQLAWVLGNTKTLQRLKKALASL